MACFACTCGFLLLRERFVDLSLGLAVVNVWIVFTVLRGFVIIL